MSATILPSPRVDVIPERWALIDQIRLSPGTHYRPSGNDLPTGMCVMEFDSWLTGGWGDRPECVSPVLWPVFQRLNDRLQDEPRQALLLYGIRALGTAGDGLDEPAGTEGGGEGGLSDRGQRVTCAGEMANEGEQEQGRRDKGRRGVSG